MAWDLVLAKEALKFLRQVRDKSLSIRLNAALEELRANPFHPGAVKLAGVETIYRVRVGGYGILYDEHWQWTMDSVPKKISQ